MVRFLHTRNLVQSFLIVSVLTFSFSVDARPLFSVAFQPCTGTGCHAITIQACDSNAINVRGTCVCKEGFIGNGHTCVEKKCQAGFYPYLDKMTGKASCVECPAGYACPDGLEKQKCSANTYSSKGATECLFCEEGWSVDGAPECCPSGKKYDEASKSCVTCQSGENCGCPSESPFIDDKGSCVECVSNTQCATNFCSNNTCCPENSTNVPESGLELSVKGCFCKTGYVPNATGTACVTKVCSEIENSSEQGTGDSTSIAGCFCDSKYPYFENGRCMRAQSCTTLMESYGYTLGKDFSDTYAFDDQNLKNVIYIAGNFTTPSDMNLTGCNLIVEGDFYNAHRLDVDSLILNTPKFEYNASHTAQNVGMIETKGITASVFENNGTLKATMATASFGRLTNRGTMIVDNIQDMNDSDGTLVNSGTLTVLTDFMFGALSETGTITNSGRIQVGNDFEGGELYNWSTIEVSGSFNQDAGRLHNEGEIKK